MKCLVTLLLLFSSAVFAQDYPAKPVRMIVPYPPGGTTDVFARRLAEGLKGRFNQPFIVENKPGAATQLGVQDAAIAGDLSPEAFAKMIADETETFRRIVTPLNLKLD